MKKLELINAELARLHTTYAQLLQAIVGAGDDAYLGQLDNIQGKMSRLYQIVEDHMDTSDDDYYLMDDDDDEEN